MRSGLSNFVIASIFLAPSLISASAADTTTPASAPSTALSAEVADSYLPAAATNGAARWPSSRIPVTYNMAEDASVPGYCPSFKSAVETAMNEWSNASGGKILFLPVDTKNAALHISWTNDPKKMNFSRELGHTEVGCDGDGIAMADIVFLTKQVDGADIDAAFARRIALHELGHALGILGHSPNPEDIMYSSTTPTDSPTLTKKDAHTILALYSPAGKEYLQKLDAVKMNTLAPGASPVQQALHLNAEAVEALKSMKYAVAIQKLEQAHGIAPADQLIMRNLGDVYYNVAAAAVMMHKPQDADNYFKKSIAMLEKCSDRNAMVPVLTNYSLVLKSTGRVDEGNKIDARIRAISSGK